MTVRVSRTFDLPVSADRVWSYIADPANRAAAISVVERYDITGDRTATWHVRLPIPFVDRTITVETEDIEIDPPTHVKFVGRSAAMHVTGEHTIEETESGSRLINEFVVDGRFPGVETFFKRNLDDELDNLERHLLETTEDSS